ncbi:hypothetical protein FB45DRAFT_876891 [Roridomyces roridus]|uniref:Uncharacterized protein n=1 Tax=Roridomyces roridus TaxID=1738132 RepID=A0AAD7B3T1_9AGAR|nr:hypothetical protein FB45DRAFT_876891 [Roridomyces roridus]
MCATPGASSDDGSSAWLVSRGPVTTRHGPSTAGNGYPVSQGTGPGPGRQNCGFRGLYGRAGTRRDGSLTRHFDGWVGALDSEEEVIPGGKLRCGYLRCPGSGNAKLFGLLPTRAFRGWAPRQKHPNFQRPTPPRRLAFNKEFLVAVERLGGLKFGCFCLG